MTISLGKPDSAFLLRQSVDSLSLDLTGMIQQMHDSITNRDYVHALGMMQLISTTRIKLAGKLEEVCVNQRN